MKIWIDFINSPQVSFFESLINELTLAGHEFVLTCRDSANTVQLIEQRNWKYKVVGEGAKKGSLRKALAFPNRVLTLYQYLRGKAVDVAICQSSFYLPITARMLGIRSIYTNDNEHALGNIPSFLFANQIFIPEGLAIEKVMRQGARRRKIVKYPGIKEGVYLWPKGVEVGKRRALDPQPSRKIFIRPEPTTAQYYSGANNFLDNVLIVLKKSHQIIMLVRDKDQLSYYSQDKFAGIQVPTNPIPFEEVAINCLLFIGAGGSMTREMAMMGVPTISVYQGELLDVDKVLIDLGLLTHQPNITLELLYSYLSNAQDGKVDDRLIEKGKNAYDLFKSAVLN